MKGAVRSARRTRQCACSSQQSHQTSRNSTRKSTVTLFFLWLAHLSVLITCMRLVYSLGLVFVSLELSTLSQATHFCPVSGIYLPMCRLEAEEARIETHLTDTLRGVQHCPYFWWWFVVGIEPFNQLEHHYPTLSNECCDTTSSIHSLLDVPVLCVSKGE